MHAMHYSELNRQLIGMADDFNESLFQVNM